MTPRPTFFIVGFMIKQKIETLVGKDNECGHFKVKLRITLSENEVQELFCQHCFATHDIAEADGKKMAEDLAEQIWSKENLQSFVNENNPNLH